MIFRGLLEHRRPWRAIIARGNGRFNQMLLTVLGNPGESLHCCYLTNLGGDVLFVDEITKSFANPSSEGVQYRT